MIYPENSWPADGQGLQLDAPTKTGGQGVWVGAIVIAVLPGVDKTQIDLYTGTSSVTSSFAAAR